MAQEEPIEISRTATIKTIAEVAGQKGKYHKIEFLDGKSVNIFNVKQLEGLAPGDTIDYGLKKSDRGYWNLTGIKKADPKPPANGNGSPAPTVETPASTSAGERMTRADWADKDRAMRSMNCLTNSTNLVIESMRVSAEFVEPRPFNEVASEAISVVRRLHAEMMALHEAPQANGTQQGETHQNAAR